MGLSRGGEPGGGRTALRRTTVPPPGSRSVGGAACGVLASHRAAPPWIEPAYSSSPKVTFAERK